MIFLLVHDFSFQAPPVNAMPAKTSFTDSGGYVQGQSAAFPPISFTSRLKNPIPDAEHQQRVDKYNAAIAQFTR
jgi:hypothetical protein